MKKVHPGRFNFPLMCVLLMMMLLLASRETLMEPRSWLIQALDMLKDEIHEQLPEGQLMLQVKDTLAQLEAFMKTVGCEF